ncbi:MAG: hypothetical protein QOJ02_3500 [Acidobacteriota bacterium]|nr:hypothetical protein [Acidobacteriota bacterium]
MDILAYILAALATLLIALSGFLYTHPSLRRQAIAVFFTSWLLYGGAICLLLMQKVRKEEAEAKPASQVEQSKLASSPEPFDVTIVTQLFHPARDMDGLYWLTSETRKTVSPVHIALIIRIVNNQPVRSMIESYSVEFLNNDEWVELVHMNPRVGRLISPNSRGEALLELNIMEEGLDYRLANRVIQPRETVRGWALFEIPPGYTVISPEPYRIHIRDTAGNELTKVVRTQTGSEFTQEAAIRSIGHADISGYALKYYSEVYPQQ